MTEVNVETETEVEVDSLEWNVYRFAEPFYNGTWNTDEPKGNNGEQTFEGLDDYVNQFRDSWDAMSELRSKIDNVLWDMQDNGKLPMDYPTIRARRSEDAAKPGRKAEQPKTLRDQLLKNKRKAK